MQEKLKEHSTNIVNFNPVKVRTIHKSKDFTGFQHKN